MPGTVCQYISYLLAILSAVFLVLCCNFLCQLDPCNFLHIYITYPCPYHTQCVPSLKSLACNPKCVKVSLAAVLFCCYQSKFHQTQSANAASFIPPGWPVPQQKAKNRPHRVPLKICNQQTGWWGKKSSSPCEVGGPRGGGGGKMTWHDVGWGFLVGGSRLGWRQSLGSTCQPQAVNSEQVS